MAEKETRDAGREALREIVDHPEQTGEHEEQLLRYLSGVAYREEQQESREEQESAGVEPTARPR